MIQRLVAIVFWILFAFIPTAFSQPFVCQANKYLSLQSNGLSKMYEVAIDPVSGSANFIPLSSPNVGFNLNAIGYRNTDNYIYGLDVFTFDLVRVDATGSGTRLGAIQGLPQQYGYYGADCTPDGKYLVLIGLDYSSEVLVLVDLEDITAQAQVMNLSSGQNFVSTDIAFNPLDGQLYGFDATSNRMYVIDPETGQVNLTKFPISNLCDAMGAVFFDSFGNFYGYGNDLGSGDARTLFKANTDDGILEKIASGPSASGKDACSCPYTVELQKEVFPRAAFPCTVVDYVFTLSNITDVIQTGIQLVDMLPEGLTYFSGPFDTFNGDLISQPGDDFFQLINMEIPPGIHEIIVQAYVEEGVEGILSNQAMLIGLPDNLGGDRISDDPTTTPEADSTRLLINPLTVDLIYDTIILCQNNELILEAATFGAEYLWQDGSTGPSLEVTEAGNYAVTVSTDCDVAIDNVVVLEQEFLLVESEPMIIDLGDSVLLKPFIIGNTSFTLQWIDPFGNSLSCTNCLTPFASPLDNVTYPFTVTPLGSDCSLEGELKVEVEKNRELYTPNVFSPNNDGLNDIWSIHGRQPFKILDLAIYSRWGEKVYGFAQGEFAESHRLWDGRLNGKAMQPAVFVWIGTFEFLDGFQVKQAGDLTLMK